MVRSSLNKKCQSEVTQADDPKRPAKILPLVRLRHDGWQSLFATGCGNMRPGTNYDFVTQHIGIYARDRAGGRRTQNGVVLVFDLG